MTIEHIAIWTPDIELLRDFYCRHFGCTAGSRYENVAKGFASYFLRFSDGPRIELMQKIGVQERPNSEVHGLTHFAFAVGSEEAVRTLTERLRAAAVTIKSEVRWTGDGYFESLVADPDGNLIEITI